MGDETGLSWLYALVPKSLRKNAGCRRVGAGEAGAGQGWLCRACTALPGTATREPDESLWAKPPAGPSCPLHPHFPTVLPQHCPEQPRHPQARNTAQRRKAKPGRAGEGAMAWSSTGISWTLEQALPARGESSALTDSLFPAPHRLPLPSWERQRGLSQIPPVLPGPPGKELKAVSFRG